MIKCRRDKYFILGINYDFGVHLSSDYKNGEGKVLAVNCNLKMGLKALVILWR